jgi:Flp pilus assembly pilin Flp
MRSQITTWLLNLTCRTHREQHGQALVEYAFVLALVVAVATAVMALAAPQLAAAIGNTIDTAASAI